MKNNQAILRLTAALLFCALASPAQHHHEPPANNAPARLLTGIGRHKHPVSTKNVEAQKFFNQGLSMVYGFNHGEAIRSFRRAAELDPQLAMAHWGIALALGPNINATMDSDAHKQAWDAVRAAVKLSTKASPRERDYIRAISARYSADPKADIAPFQRKYAEAMRELVKKHPDDLDARTLFAESLMNLYPWKLWTLDGKPSPVTEEVIAALDYVLERDPEHIGACHYTIHAVEASPTPQRGLVAARSLAPLTPAVGHLVHMPAHIYMRTGDYEAAAVTNILAAEADKQYIANGGVDGMYRAYWAHNLHFISAARSMQGRYRESLEAAGETLRVMAPLGNAVPGFEPPAAAALLVPVRFRDWEKVLAAPEPPKDQKTMHNLWVFARGMAYAAKKDLANAIREREKFREGVLALPDDRTYGINQEKAVMKLPLLLLDAKIAEARGDLPQALGHLREAVLAEDSLAYNEPPDWYYPPSREAFGGLLLRMNRGKDAEEVFREDLRRNQRNGRSLFGLYESLKQQKRVDQASMVLPLYEKAWEKADKPLTASDLF